MNRTTSLLPVALCPKPVPPGRKRLRTAFLSLVASCLAAVAADAPAATEIVVEPRLPLKAALVRDGAVAAMLEPQAFGPKWAWYSLGSPKSPVAVTQTVSADGDAVRLEFGVSATAAMEIVQVISSLTPGPELRKIEAKLASGETRELALPVVRGEVPAISALHLDLNGGERVEVGIEPPCTLANENGALRVQLAKDRLEAGTAKVTFTMKSSGGLKLSQSPEALRPHLFRPGEDWAPLAPSQAEGAPAIAMNDWLERPAGKSGRVRFGEGGRLVYPDGKPVRWWGTNVQYAENAPPQAQADLHAARLAAWGVNCLRLHKFSDPAKWAGFGDPTDVTAWAPEGLARFDYFLHRLREEGVRYGISHTFGLTIPEGSRDRVLAYDEIQWQGKKGVAYALINVAEDVQDLMIEKIVNLLKHVNPHTGQPLAADAALSYLELQNEDDIFFFTLGSALAKAPTYRAKYERDFAAWLAGRYASREAWTEAWQGATKAGDEWGVRAGVESNPWILGADSLPRITGGQRRRLLDQAAFMEATQMKFYDRFAKAIREAGYDGPLIGSPWQAPAGLPHLLNLRCDARVGIVDRHNYWGGWGMVDSTILSTAAGGTLSTGLQQVAGRPFMLSEWNTLWPSLYSAEMPVVIAAYGLGLQGWAGSFQFNSQAGPTEWSPTSFTLPWGRLQVDLPNLFGQYPILSRMVQRGDVKEGPVISVRRVSDRALATGEFDFEEKIVQEGANGDIKTFGGTVPQAALVVGRALVEFTGAEEKPSAPPDLASNGKEGRWVSATGELVWDTARRVMTIDTAGTQGVVGFAAGQEWKLASCQIRPSAPYASILLTAAGPREDLANCRSALLSAVARVASSGLDLYRLGGAMESVLEQGGPPVLIEPVRATIRPARKPSQVEVLDHGGRRSGRTLPVAADGAFEIDTTRDGGWLYELRY